MTMCTRRPTGAGAAYSSEGPAASGSRRTRSWAGTTPATGDIFPASAGRALTSNLKSGSSFFSTSPPVRMYFTATTAPPAQHSGLAEV